MINFIAKNHKAYKKRKPSELLVRFIAVKRQRSRAGRSAGMRSTCSPSRRPSARERAMKRTRSEGGNSNELRFFAILGAPCGNGGVVAAQEDIGDFEAAELGWTGVLGEFERLTV